MIDMNRLGEIVKEKRGGRGLRTASKEIGISPTTLSKVERGHFPDTKTLLKICDWADCKIVIQNI